MKPSETTGFEDPYRDLEDHEIPENESAKAALPYDYHDSDPYGLS